MLKPKLTQQAMGIEKKELWNSDATTLGYNYRLSDVASALGINQLKRLDGFH